MLTARQIVLIDYINKANLSDQRVSMRTWLIYVYSQITDRISCRITDRTFRIKCHVIDRKMGGAY